MKKRTNMQLAIPPGVDAALCFIDGQYYLQHVDGDGQKGKFLSPASVRAAFRDEAIDTGWLPEGASRWGIGPRGVWMLRFHPPAVRSLYLDGVKRALRVPMPALVWFAIGNAYYIWSMRVAKLTPQAPLFHAPLANVNNLGLICFGDNEHGAAAKGGFEPAWQMFWKAPFNDHHDTGKSVRLGEKGSINTLLRELHRSRAQSYPLDDLVALRGSLDSMVTRLTDRASRNRMVFDEENDNE